MITDLHSQADAYSLGALTLPEAIQFERHLETCAACQAEVAELRELAARLSETVATAPPAHLRATILAQIATTPQEQPSSPQVLTELSSAPAASPVPADNVVAMRPSRRHRGSALLAAASVIAAAGFGGWAWDSREDAQRDATQLRITAATAERQTDQITALLTARDVRAVPGTFVHGGIGKVIYSDTAGTAMLMAANLPELPGDQVYQAWTIKDTPAPAATFSAGAATAIPLPAAALDATSIAVTIEPLGGSQHPTTDAVFTANL